MEYIVTYRTNEPITPGRCVDCPQHFMNMNPEPGEQETGCGLSGKLIPDECNTEITPWSKCPILKVKKRRQKRRDKNGGKREI